MDPSTLEREIRRMSERGIYCGNIPAGREDYEAGFMSAMGHCADALKKALAEAAPVRQTCKHCTHAGRRFELIGGGYQVCLQSDMAHFGRPQCVPLLNRDGSVFGCTLHVPASPRTSEETPR